MYEMVIVACLSASPTQCEFHHVPGEGTELECMVYSQMVVKQWQDMHPKWDFKKVICQPTGTVGA